jgi:hypothetical protein
MAVNYWYFDAWAVNDGLAFVSQRRSDSIDSTATVFMSVPDLEAVPVGRISTALHATRYNFQDGFRNTNGDEFAFDNLDQVREVIRRAYLAGGLGPEPAGERQPPQDPWMRISVPPRSGPELPFAAGGNYFEHSLNILPSIAQLPSDYSDLRYPDKREAILLSLHKAGPSSLYPYLRAFAEATVVECVTRFGRDLYAEKHRRLLHNWLSVLWMRGFWDEWNDFDRIIQYCGLPIPDLEGAAPVSTSILFSIPCPLRPMWAPKIRFLSHKLLLPLIISDYFQWNNQLPEIIPAIFCSMILSPFRPAFSRAQPETSLYDRQLLLGHALSWLKRELPSIALPDEVEAELTNYALRQLDRN